MRDKPFLTASKGKQFFARHEEQLAQIFVDWAKSKDNVRVLGPLSADKDDRAPTFSFIADGISSADICAKAGLDQVAIRHGDFYARRLVEAVGIDPDDGVIRCSMAHYNTVEEVERLVAALDKAV